MNRTSSLMAKYLEMYRQKPSSRVFAPLAESYRKLGMMDEALKVLRDGLKYNPTYVLGYIVLANCYYDQEKFELCYNTLKPLQATNQDNLSLQKTFAESCLKIGNYEEALDVYKYLLYINPKDEFIQERVRVLENELVIKEKEIAQTQITRIPISTFDDDNWVQVDFAHQKNEEKPFLENPKNTKPIISLDEPLVTRTLDDEFFIDEEYDVGEESGEAEEIPLISHTLVDLYISQNYLDKAHALLEQYAKLFPHDSRTIRKLDEVKSLMNKTENLEEAGHEKLISIIENNVKKPSYQTAVRDAYSDFIDIVKTKAFEKKQNAQNSHY